MSAWYQTIGLHHYISADLKNLLKLLRLFKQQKTFLGGLTTPQGALPNQGDQGESGVNLKQNRGARHVQILTIPERFSPPLSLLWVHFLKFWMIYRENRVISFIAE